MKERDNMRKKLKMLDSLKFPVIIRFVFSRGEKETYQNWG